MPPGHGGWVRAVALLVVVGMVTSLGYLGISALAMAQAPIWLTFTLVSLLIGVSIALLARREDRF